MLALYMVGEENPRPKLPIQQKNQLLKKSCRISKTVASMWDAAGFPASCAPPPLNVDASSRELFLCVEGFKC